MVNIILKCRNVSRFKKGGICSCGCVVVIEEFPLMLKWNMKHELVLTVLLVLGTMGVGRAVRPHDDHNLLLPPGWAS